MSMKFSNQDAFENQEPATVSVERILMIWVFTFIGVAALLMSYDPQSMKNLMELMVY